MIVELSSTKHNSDQHVYRISSTSRWAPFEFSMLLGGRFFEGERFANFLLISLC